MDVQPPVRARPSLLPFCWLVIISTAARVSLFIINQTVSFSGLTSVLCPSLPLDSESMQMPTSSRSLFLFGIFVCFISPSPFSSTSDYFVASGTLQEPPQLFSFALGSALFLESSSFKNSHHMQVLAFNLCLLTNLS